MLCGYRSAMLSQEANRRRATLSLSSDSEPPDGGEPGRGPPVRLPMLNVRPTSMLMRRFRSHPALSPQESRSTGSGLGMQRGRSHQVTVSEVSASELLASSDSSPSRHLHRHELAVGGAGHRQGSALDRFWQTGSTAGRGFSVLPSKYGTVDRKGWDYASTPSPPRDSLGRPYKGSPTSRAILEPLSGGQTHPQLQDVGVSRVTEAAIGGGPEQNRQESKYQRLPLHREVFTIDKSPGPAGNELNKTLRLAECSQLVSEKGGVGPSKYSLLQEKAANGRKLASSAPATHKAQPGQRYSYHGDSPSSSSRSPAATTPPTAHRNGNNHSDHSDQPDRSLTVPSKQSERRFSVNAHSESSDEDPNGITLSNTTRSKLKLLTKRNEMRKGLDRSQHEAVVGYHQVPAHSYHKSDERSRKFRQLQKELSHSNVESRLAGHQHLSRPEKRTDMLPSPDNEGKSSSMQNLAVQKSKHQPLPTSKTFGAELNRRAVPRSVSSMFGDHLEPFANPRHALEEAYRKLNSDDWEREVSGLTDLVRLFRHHPETASGDMKSVMAAIVRQMKNLRSQVLRAAVQTSAEMFQHVGKATEPNVEKIVAILLQKTSDTNKFIKADSNRALDVMLDNVSTTRVIVAVTSEGLGHRSSQVRATVARLLAAAVRRLGAAGSLSGQKDITERLVPAAAQLVRQGDLQTRIYAKEIFHQWLQYPDLERVLGKYLSGTLKRDIDKVIDNIKNEDLKKKTSAPGKRGFGSRVRLNRTM